MIVTPSPEDVTLFQLVESQVIQMQQNLNKAMEARKSLVSMIEKKYDAKLDESGTLVRE